MKKLFVYALSAVALLAVSCNNKNNPVQPSAPATKDLAQVIKFSAPLTVGAYSFQSIELTEASRFIAEYTQTKAILSETDVLFGKFTFSNGVFELEGLGSMKIEGNTVTLNPSAAGGGPVQAQATITPTSSSDLEDHQGDCGHHRKNGCRKGCRRREDLLFPGSGRGGQMGQDRRPDHFG